MLIAFNTNAQLFGGGGFHFIRSLSESLVKNGHEVRYDLKYAPNAIIVVVQDSKANFRFDDVRKFQKNHETKVILRINNLDTHAKKGSIKHYQKYKPITDVAVFMSAWSQNYAHEKFDLLFNRESVIHNCPQSLFFTKNCSIWNHKEPLRLVTHHWSTNNKKGFDTYSKIGKAVAASSELRSMFHLCYIGRSPKKLPGFVMKPFLRGRKLVEKIAAQHVYLTASELEVGPNHVLEGLACGLPVLYGPNGGAVSEYVGECGFEFKTKNIIDYLIIMRENYNYYSNLSNIRKSQYNPDKICQEYLSILK